MRAIEFCVAAIEMTPEEREVEPGLEQEAREWALFCLKRTITITLDQKVSDLRNKRGYPFSNAIPRMLAGAMKMVLYELRQGSIALLEVGHMLLNVAKDKSAYYFHVPTYQVRHCFLLTRCRTY